MKKAQDVQFGQLGNFLCIGTGAVTVPTDRVIVAISFLSDSTITTLNPETSDFLGTDSGDSGEELTTTQVFPKGFTLYGRYDAFELATGDAVVYFGQ